ncbi:hypothetical protein L0F63_001344 [Massospora cicadina]|nr:hypothetical protein L0F63_001344 [Massospora cicadina]
MKVGVMHNVRLDADLIARVVGGHLTGSVACDTHGSVAPTKLLRLGLEVVSNGLVPGLARPCLESTFHDIALRLLLDAGLDAPSFGAVLACMREGLGLVRGGGELAAGLQRRAYDLQWAARDSVVEFVGQLLSGDKPGVKFASDHNLHNILIQAVEDSEPYVRATAYQALARSVANPQLPTEFVQSVESALMEAGRLSLGTLPGELQRRSHLDLLIELLTFHTRHMELPLPSCLPIHSLNGLADDGDTEVVVRAVRLAHAWWNYELAVYTSRQLKRARLEVSAFDFFKLKLDELLIFKLEDASRLVRQAAIEALQKISNDCTSKVAPNWTQDSKLHLEKICSIDFKLHSDCELNLHPDACDLDPLLAPSPEHEPQRPKVNVSKVVDDSGWFTSDSETYDQDDTEDYNVMDCY